MMFACHVLAVCSSGSYDDSLKVWGVADGRLLLAMEDLGDDLLAVHFADEDDDMIITYDSKQIYAIRCGL